MMYFLNDPSAEERARKPRAMLNDLCYDPAMQSSQRAVSHGRSGSISTRLADVIVEFGTTKLQYPCAKPGHYSEVEKPERDH
ncbi:MAG: hypothetical protein ACLRIL_03335 [Fusicatenibacter saccharivorans]